MKVEDFDYYLPKELIAQRPIYPRDAARLMVLHKNTGEIEHKVFRDIVAYLKAGDVLVLNKTRVLPARLKGRRADSGGKVEILLLNEISLNKWKVLVKPGKRARPGRKLIFGKGELLGELIGETDEGERILSFDYEGNFYEILERLGEMPLPPYIKEKLSDRERYQTVYGDIAGSAAAPTAGLHFTQELLNEIKNKGVFLAYILLHVGLGTFRPVKTENIEDHRMHSEYFQIEVKDAETINRVRKNGGRVIAVGTTTVRTLETAAGSNGEIFPKEGWTDIFIYPGYKFKAVDCMITNFHLPKSTLIMLVSAFAGKENILNAYNIAVKEKYRFFSFGDAMFIL
ncbi:MAG: tRNA preQ1(34) S-adenosylmethionine ribosyltransferase-isomerase QueA [Clostridia bacterium]|nr:tRNA preQ1(34) S-adenosylmethionine ribosyltransferase-isomerase QueA [Clostridia bacterium]